MTSTSLHGQVALVTGGGSGIGEALCHRLGARGAHVVVADIDRSGAARVAAGVGGTALPLDVGDRSAWEDAMAMIREHHGRLDAVALNAGTMIRPRGQPTDDDPLPWTVERYELLRSVNIDGVAYGVLAAIADLEATGGRIVVTASVAGLKPLEIDPAYSMTKHAVIGLVRSIAAPLAKRGVTIGAVCPGGVDTPLVSPDIRAMNRTFAAPDHVAAALETVLDAPTADTGGIWVCRADEAPWRHEFTSPDHPPA